MESITLHAYAKINLTLDITGSHGGYHTIDSVVCSVDIADVITLSRRADSAVNITMQGCSCAIEYGQNNAVKAALAFGSAFNTGGCDIAIQKNIPVAAGLGGSSADVAGVLCGLSKLHGITDYAAVKELADSLGSDCGYMLRGGCARITGRGERVSPLPYNGSLALIIALPQGGVSTAKCYALSDVYPEHRRTSQAVQSAICGGQLAQLGAALSNGLYPAAAVINPDIRHAVNDLAALNPLGVNMSGSGSAVYALFGDVQSRDRALKNYSGRRPVLAAHTITPQRYI